MEKEEALMNGRWGKKKDVMAMIEGVGLPIPV